MSERIFDLGNGITVACRFEKTRMAFRHVAVVFKDGKEEYRTKIAYQNRTWESYEFQSVLMRAIEKCGLFNEEEKKKALEFARKDHTDWSGFNHIFAVAKMGEILCDTKEAKNDWKQRMLKAGLGDDISFPDDWDKLSEEEKEARLNGALSIMQKKKVKQ